MPPVGRLRILIAAGGLAFALAIGAPGAASGQDESDPAEGAAPPAQDEPPASEERGPDPQEDAKLLLRTEGDSGGTVTVGNRVRLIGRLRPFVPDQRILLRYGHHGKVLKQRRKKVRQIGHSNVGMVKMKTKALIRPGRYRAAAIKEETPEQKGGKATSGAFRTAYPDLDPGQNNPNVRLFNRLLRRKNYYVSTGSGYGAPTERAVMAFRKVNGMRRTYNASPDIFRKLADGKGGFNLKRPGLGRHVEVDISRQVMVLADHRRAQHIFHISSGAPSTPSDRGTYRFYRRQPGYNSLGMYYSVYYNRGEAIHGYHSVPPYNASHGCIRNPIPNSRWIYNWVSLGMNIAVYD